MSFGLVVMYKKNTHLDNECIYHMSWLPLPFHCLLTRSEVCPSGPEVVDFDSR